MPVSWRKVENSESQNLVFVFCSTRKEFRQAIDYWEHALGYIRKYTHTARSSAEHYYRTDEGWDSCDFGANADIVAVLVFSET